MQMAKSVSDTQGVNKLYNQFKDSQAEIARLRGFKRDAPKSECILIYVILIYVYINITYINASIFGGATPPKVSVY